MNSNYCKYSRKGRLSPELSAKSGSSCDVLKLHLRFFGHKLSIWSPTPSHLPSSKPLIAIMPRATPRRSARRWGSRFDVISGSQLTDSSSLTSDDAITTFAAGTTKTNGKASSESGFGDESSSAASQPTATTATAANQSALSDPYSASEGGAFVWGDEPHDIGVSWDADPLPSPRSRTSVNPNASDNSKSFPITYSSPPHHPPFSSDFKGPSLPPRRLQRWNHNASVFVASLPPEPNAELDKYLHESLGKHGNILNIKFIHDVRSGHASNCAFVQFEVSAHSSLHYIGRDTPFSEAEELRRIHKKP